MTVTRIRTHVTVTFANAYLACDTCHRPVPGWHNPDLCGCGGAGWQNRPCGHQAGVTNTCPTWNPVDGCTCPGTHTDAA